MLGGYFLKKVFGLIITICVIIVAFLGITLFNYNNTLKQIDASYLTSWVVSEDCAYIYDFAKKTGSYLKNPYFEKVIMVTGYLDENNYYALAKNGDNFYIINFKDGQVLESIEIPERAYKISKWNDEIIFAMCNDIYITNFQENEYDIFISSVAIRDHVKSAPMEPFFVFQDKVLYAKEIPNDDTNVQWCIVDTNFCETPIDCTNEYSPVLCWISDHEILMYSYQLGIYIYDVESKDKIQQEHLENIFPPSCVSASQNYLIAHMPANGNNTSKVVIINIKSGKRTNVYNYPIDCLGDTGICFELSG